jgi:uncharacterized membrane protein HdeD (DUF308 family)
MLTFFTPFSRLSLLEFEVRKTQILQSYTVIMNGSLRWLSGVQIGLGVLSIILSGFVLAFPGFAFLSLVILLAVVFFFVGIETIITAIFVPSSSKSKWLSVALGALVLIFVSIAIASPAVAAIAIIAFMAVSMVFNGCARIVEGIRGRHPKGTKALLIGAGILSLILGSLVMVYPLIGVVLAATFLAIGLMISGIQMIAAGVLGRTSEVRSRKGKDDDR